MAYTKPASIKILRSVYRLMTGFTPWVEIFRGHGAYNAETAKTLKENNTKLLIRTCREWLDKCENEL